MTHEKKLTINGVNAQKINYRKLFYTVTKKHTHTSVQNFDLVDLVGCCQQLYH
jgi:hypothetical protein